MLVYLAFLVLLRQVFVLVRLYPSPFIFSTALDLQLPQLLIKQLSQLQEELDRRNLPTLLLELNVFLVLGGQSDFFWLELQVIEELLQKMLHQVHDAQSCHLVTGHLYQQEAQLVLLWIQAASLHDDPLLLCDGGLNRLYPVDHVSVARRQLVCPPNFHEVVQRLAVLLVRQLKGQLFELELPLEEIHGILLVRTQYSMHRQDEFVELE